MDRRDIARRDSKDKKTTHVHARTCTYVRMYIGKDCMDTNKNGHEYDVCT